ncbi:MAG: PUR family DNA/RNA-binding protein [Bacteroidales bacterium]|nr:PUR family DNA/RNA-binding protein [Bacteroidales bacterium]
MYSEENDYAGALERGADDVYSKPVRAGKRTYFFDVKATKGNDYYLTITESKRKVERDGRFVYEKHKIFLYKEDFEKFAGGLQEVVEYIKQRCPVVERVPEARDENEGGNYSVNFDEI